MAATTTPKISSLLKRIYTDFIDISFAVDDGFRWSPDSNTVFHPEIINVDDLYQLLHEIAHAKLGHKNYDKDAELITMERQAWEFACQVATKYSLPLSMDQPIVQVSLDSYRQWLHSRSLCPDCQAVGAQTQPGDYRCLVCQATWRANEAKTCQLRRYKQ